MFRVAARSSCADRPGCRSSRRILATVVALVVITASCTGSSKQAGPSETTLAGHPARTAALTVKTTDEPRALPHAFFGFNGASIVQSVNVDLLVDSRLQHELATFPTRLIRVPTGTAAQWLNWRTGRFIENPTSPFAKIPKDRRPVTMTDWATLIRTARATPVWDLNVLNATLDDQIAMLDEATKLGLDVRYIELGNELWDSRSIYPTRFPTGADYATEMNTWIAALRKAFPKAQIAVSGADPSDEFFSQVFGERYREWNTQVLATVRGADAIAIHPYWTLPDRADPGSDVEATLTAGLDAFARFESTTLPEIPDGMDVWLTEWNQAAWASKSGTQIWAQALSVVAVGMEQATHPAITMSLVHDIVDGEENPHDAGISITFPTFTDGARGSKAMEQTALGHALPLLFGAVGPGSTVTALQIDTTPMVGGHPGVRGIQITKNAPGALFVNLSNRQVDVQLPESLSGRWHTITVTAGADTEPGWIQGDEPTRVDGTATGTVALPAHSIVRLSRG